MSFFIVMLGFLSYRLENNYLNIVYSNVRSFSFIISGWETVAETCSAVAVRTWSEKKDDRGNGCYKKTTNRWKMLDRSATIYCNARIPF